MTTKKAAKTGKIRAKSVPKKSSDRRSTKPSTTSQTEDKTKAEALTLLRGMTQPREAALLPAREAIKKLVVEGNESKISVADKLLFLLSCALSTRNLPGYATLDSNHLEQIDKLVSGVQNYVNDPSQKRPLNFLMLASPGAGKSHFIKCIAKKLQRDNVGAITFNMAGLQRYEDLIPPLDSARNLKVGDGIPLLFLDEFDADPANIALLLPLLWDGELNLGQRDLKLGKVVVVLAGSDSSLPNTMEEARSMRAEVSVIDGRSPKVVDLLSRINGGVILIPPFCDLAHGIDRRFDKVCIAAQLLRQRFGEKLTHVPLALLRFLARTEFRYGVRSMAHLIELIPFKKDITVLKMGDLKLQIDDPMKLKASSLAYHLLHDDQAHGVAKVWQEVSATEEVLPILSKRLDRLPFGTDVPKMYLEFSLQRIMSEIQAVSI